MNPEGIEQQESLEDMAKQIMALNTHIEDSIGKMEVEPDHIQTMIDDAGKMISQYEAHMGKGNEEFDTALDTLMFTKDNLLDLLNEGNTRASENFRKEEEDDVGTFSPTEEEAV